MNIKKSVAGLVAGFALVGSIAAPAALAQDAGTQTVVVTDGGSFNAYFCVPSGNVPIHTTTYGLTLQSAPNADANTPGKATGNIAICYLDTVSYRGGFDTKIQASDFISADAVADTPITADNYKITGITAVRQQQQSSAQPTQPRIGDIGYCVNELDPGGQGAGAPWTASNTLDAARRVHFSWPGRGTIASGGAIGTELTIPSGTDAGTYVSNLTLTIIPDVR